MDGFNSGSFLIWSIVLAVIQITVFSVVPEDKKDLILGKAALGIGFNWLFYSIVFVLTGTSELLGLPNVMACGIFTLYTLRYRRVHGIIGIRLEHKFFRIPRMVVIYRGGRNGYK